MKTTFPARAIRTSRCIALASVVVMAASFGTLATADTAAASDSPGSYTNYRFPCDTEGLNSVTFRTTVTQDAGPASNIFWSHQFGFTAGNGAYTGMQSNGPGQTRTFLFSLG